MFFLWQEPSSSIFHRLSTLVVVFLAVTADVVVVLVEESRLFIAQLERSVHRNILTTSWSNWPASTCCVSTVARIFSALWIVALCHGNHLRISIFVFERRFKYIENAFDETLY
jgi:hypothetical protein